MSDIDSDDWLSDMIESVSYTYNYNEAIDLEYNRNRIRQIARHEKLRDSETYRANLASQRRSKLLQERTQKVEKIEKRAQALVEGIEERKQQRELARIERRKRTRINLLARQRVKAHKRRARKLAVGGTFTTADIKLQLKSQKGRCWHCGNQLGDRYHADHLIPLARGGSNDARNIVVSCPECNFRKGAKLPYEFNGRLF